jgi:hypothetical protein
MADLSLDELKTNTYDGESSGLMLPTWKLEVENRRTSPAKFPSTTWKFCYFGGNLSQIKFEPSFWREPLSKNN